MDRRLPPLTCDNWNEWKKESKIILNRLYLWSIVDDDQLSDKHKALDDAIVEMILFSIEDKSLMISLAKNCSSSNNLWQKLCEHFESSASVNIETNDEIESSNFAAIQIKKDTHDVQIQSSLLDLSGSLPDDFEELFALVQQLEIKVIETLSEIKDESLVIEKGIRIRQQFLDFIGVVENFCVPCETETIITCDSPRSSNLINDVSDFKPREIETIDETKCKSKKSKPTVSECENEITFENITTCENQNNFLDDQHNKSKDEEVIDEILVCLKEPTANDTVVENDSSFLRPNNEKNDNLPWLKTNDLNLWSRLLILDQTFLSKLDKFYCNSSGEYWLFDDDGKIFRYGHHDRNREDFTDIQSPILINELSNELIKSIVPCFNYKSTWSLILTQDGQLYAIGDNQYGQLGIGNTEFQHRPVFVSGNIRKVSCGIYHALAITNDGKVLSSGSNQFFQNGHKIKSHGKLTLSEIDSFRNDRVMDITCTINASIIMKEFHEIYLFGSFNRNIFFPPKLIIFDSFITRIVGGRDEFLVLSNEMKQNHDRISEQAHIYQSNNESKFISHKIKFDFSESKIIAVYPQIYSSNYVFVTEDGLCHIICYQQPRQIITTKFSSVPDVFCLFLYPQTGSIIRLPKELTQNLDRISTLNNPGVADIIFKIPNSNVLYAERERLSGRSFFWHNSFNCQWASKYPATIHFKYLPFYLYLRFVYEMPDLKMINLLDFIEELYDLGRKFEDGDFIHYLNNLANRKAKINNKPT
ncbi:hypothetical protein HUG17_8039 [Dermatophagoides farinae]|uniref:Uncharacterized protein n=1 Tax=Dermatophagoides farinae TaxID=6954 RepID=A0A9D4SGU7_DERFA|nr:uncharacterized protein LOC124495974 [Dermatophagoides farinae]KAH7640570.1 hypothetical protein HUG17_8039 [Dermatophagoides farinae]